MPAHAPTPGPETTAFLQRIPSLAWRGLIYVVGLLLTGALVWASLSDVDEIVVAGGQLVCEDDGLTVDAPVSGEIVEVRVREGRQVRAGQPLLWLRSPRVARELSDLRQAERARARAHKELEVELPRREQRVDATLAALQAQRVARGKEQVETRARIASEETVFALAVQRQQQVLKALSARREALLGEVKLQGELLRQATANRDEKAALVKTGAIPRSELRTLDSAVTVQQLALQKQRDGLAAVDAEQVSEQLRARQLEPEYQLKLQTHRQALHRLTASLAELDRQIETLRLARLRERQQTERALAQASDQYEHARSVVAPGVQLDGTRVVLRAPVDGLVTYLISVRQGEQVEPGERLVQIVPTGAPLVAEVRVPNSRIGHLAVGQRAKLKYAAYPFQQYGVFEGRVAWIASDSQQTNDPRVPADQRLSYAVRITLDDAHVDVDGARRPLKLGLSVSGEIVTRQRRVIRLILAPFEALLRDDLSVDR